MPGTARILVIFGLERDDEGLAAEVRETSDPDSPRYGRFLTAAQVSRRFGASADDRTKVLDRLRDAGVKGTVSASGGAVFAPMTASQVHEVLGSWPQATRTDQGWDIAEVQQELRVPSSLSGAVTEVVGGRSTVRAPATASLPGSPTSPPCRDTSGTEVAGRPSPLGEWYGFDDYLYRDQVRGDGRRIGLLAIGRWSDASLDAVVECYGTRPSGKVTVVPAPVTPKVPVGPEVALDVVVASSFAPDAQIDVLQYDPHGSVAAAFLQAVDAGATGQPYDAVSTSIGYCEGDLEADELSLTDHALLALAATGTTVFASSGDTGSAACAPSSTKASVQYPASSPWIAGVGGTSLRADADGTISDEVVWSNPSSANPLAGGGGSSARYDAPWYQRGLEPPGGNGKRAVPDVAFLADPSVVPPIPICPDDASCSWYQLAGTSAPAPALAAAVALVDEDLSGRADEDRRLGLLPPLVRQLATGDRRADGVHDVTEGSNRVLGLRCCDAAPGFDLATGWGSLVLPVLADAADEARSAGD